MCQPVDFAPICIIYKYFKSQAISLFSHSIVQTRTYRPMVPWSKALGDDGESFLRVAFSRRKVRVAEVDDDDPQRNSFESINNPTPLA
jgi:hypothetical protein